MGEQQHTRLNSHDLRYQDIRKVTLIGSVIDLLLAILKLLFGWIGQSQALIADGIHSLSDLLTDALVIYTAKHANKEADERHPYGHGRFETIATVILGGTLILVGIGIAWDATLRLFEPESLLNPGWLALAVAALSVVLKEAIYQYTARAAKRLRSRMLHANAWHSRTDAISSIFVIIGIGGAMLGLNYLDAIAAIIVAIMIAKVGGDLVWQSIQELTDEALDQEQVKAIEQCITGISSVCSLHLLRTRRMGGDALVDVHIQVEPYLSVSEGHQISEVVRNTLINQFDEINDVMVHIDPEDDEHSRSDPNLPLRNEVEKILHEAWADEPESVHIKRILLHYLDNEIEVEITFPLKILANIQDSITVNQRFSRITTQGQHISRVIIHYESAP